MKCFHIWWHKVETPLETSSSGCLWIVFFKGFDNWSCKALVAAELQHCKHFAPTTGVSAPILPFPIVESINIVGYIIAFIHHLSTPLWRCFFSLVHCNKVAWIYTMFAQVFWKVTALQRREEKKRRSRLRLRQLHITVSSKLNSMVVGDGVRTLIRFNCKFNHLFFFYSALQCIIRSVIL